MNDDVLVSSLVSVTPGPVHESKPLDLTLTALIGDVKWHAVDLSKVECVAAPGASLTSEDSVSQPSESSRPQELPTVRVDKVDPIRVAWLHVNPRTPFPRLLGGVDTTSNMGTPGRPRIRRVHIRFGRKPTQQTRLFNL